MRSCSELGRAGPGALLGGEQRPARGLAGGARGRRGRRALGVRAQQGPGGDGHLGCGRRQTIGTLGTAALLSCLPRRAMASNDAGQELLEKRVSEFQLSNGLHFIVLERHTAPVVSCHTFANVGAFEEEDGMTGLAHLLEHEAFKGSTRIGTSDWAKEEPLLDAQDEVFYALREARRQHSNGGLQERLHKKLASLQEKAGKYSVPNEFGARLTRAGAVGLNASTSHDATRYVASLPSNVLELWFALEAERFKDPVFRELYSEKRVVLEERRSRVDNAPLGKFQETFNLRAFANAYRRPVIGFKDDIENAGRLEVQAFFQKHYVPSNLTIAIVGDVKPDQVFNYAKRYFGGWNPAQEDAQSEAAVTVAKPNRASSSFEQTSRAGPVLMKAFYRGTVNTTDAIRLQVIADVLVGRRTSRLERGLVQNGTAYVTNFVPAFPGDKHPCAALLYTIPAKGVSLDGLESELDRQLEDLASHGVTRKEMQRIKKAAKLEAVESIRFNTTMAASLASYHALTGSWRTLLADLDAVDNLAPEDIRRTAEKLFQDSNSFTGLVLPESARPAEKPRQSSPQAAAAAVA